MIPEVKTIIAFAALALSLFNAYFTFRKKTKLRFAYTSLNIGTTDGKHNSLILDFVLINSGDRPATIRKLAAIILYPDNNIGQRDWLDITNGEKHTPVVVKPGEAIADRALFRFSERTFLKMASADGKDVCVTFAAAMIDPVGNMLERTLMHAHLGISPGEQGISHLNPPLPQVIQLLPVPHGEKVQGLFIDP